MFQVIEKERELKPMREKLETDMRSTEKFDEKVDEWKVCKITALSDLLYFIFFILLSTVCMFLI